MNHREPTTLESFHRFLGKQLETEAAIDMSPEQALEIWREEWETLAAIREGLEDVAAGRTASLQEFKDEFHRKHGVPDNQ